MMTQIYQKDAIIWQIFFSDHIDQMCKFSSKSGGGYRFKFHFFFGDLTRNDPQSNVKVKYFSRLS